MGCGKSNTNAKAITNPQGIILHYFDIHGRAESIRIILKYKGISFTDHRVQQDEWPALRNSGLAEFGALPMVEIDGEKLVESKAIARYLCRKFGYYPSNLADSYLVESICDVCVDIFAGVSKAVMSKNEDNIRKFFEEDFAWWLKKI